MKEDLTDLSVVEINSYTSSFLSEMEKLESENFNEAGLTRWTLPFFIGYGKVFALYAGEELAGLAEMMRDFDDPKRVFIAGFSVCKKYRGHGAGNFFLEAVLGMLAGEAGEISLTAAKENEAAIALYKHHGFTEAGLEKDFFGPGEDRLVLTRNI